MPNSHLHRSISTPPPAAQFLQYLAFQCQYLYCLSYFVLLQIMAVHTTSLLGLLAPIILLLGLLSAPASVFALTGQATYYGPPFTPSSCYGFDTGPFGPEPYMIAAASPGLFNNRAACGVSYRVTCLGATSGAANGCSATPTVTVKVVDLCPGCTEPGIDLSPAAFSTISRLDVGRINIEFTR
ncbi:hypothetical protein M758_6G083700 [Ceratodon purpureus]|nr:hypothetical protein KC19_6G088300 [Ceratodon purpureus]KAG0613187.1 hypothetical protein M758_6G083700 [Ceratodon purpureus]